MLVSAGPGYSGRPLKSFRPRPSASAARFLAVALAAALALAPSLPLVSHAEETLETVELKPKDPASWSPASLLSPITSLFRGGPGHWFSPREIIVRTTPPGAGLDFFYVRRSFQKGFEQGDAPVRLLLPSPSSASDYDTVKIRAFLDGYRQEERSIAVRSRMDEIVIELQPVANRLLTATHLYFGDRAWIGFVTKEQVVTRTQDSRDGFTLILLETSASDEALASLAKVKNPLIRSLRPQQLGQDLVVHFALTERADLEQVRNAQEFDPISGQHRFRVAVEPKGGARDAVRRSLDALARVRAAEVSGCALRFEDELVARLAPGETARALTQVSPIAKYLRAAMRRLGELSPNGQVRLRDGTTYRTASGIELTAAMSQPAEVRGYFAMLRAFIAQLETGEARDETLRGILAPELAPDRFTRVLAAGHASEAACRAN